MKLSKAVLSSITICLFFYSISHAAEVIDLAKNNANNTIKEFMIGSPPSAKLADGNPTSEQELRVLSRTSDPSSHTVHTRYQQYYKGIPIWGKQIIKHESSAKKPNPHPFTGKIVKAIEKDISNAISPNQSAKQDVLKLMKQEYIQKAQLKNPEFSNEKSELYYYLDEKNKAHLAYVVSFFVTNKNDHSARPYFIVDAQTKEILKTWNGLTSITSKIKAFGPGGNEKTGFYTYGKEYDFLDIMSEGKLCFLDNDQVKTVDLNHQKFSITNSPYSFNCASPEYMHKGDEFKGAASVQDDAHYFGNIIFRMYREWYDMDPLKFKLIMRVHYGNNYGNAFWNGSCMTFGDGDDNSYPLVCLDIAAHEVSHGVVEQNSNLNYVNQSGAINESFADMAGKTAEYFMKHRNTWGIGEDIVKPGRGYTCADGSQDALRCMDNPETDGFSISNVKDYEPLVNTLRENLTIIYPDAPDTVEEELQILLVHTASGIFNKAFYIIATSPNWDVRKAFAIMLHANRNYWEPDATFTSAAEGVIRSTQDLGYDVKTVIDAFQQVGIQCTETNCVTIQPKGSTQQ